MPSIHLCFLWHMHQPFYKDLASGEYKLPWTRMHALKDYYGMVRILEEFPAIRQTFNLVPSMMAQVEEYAAGTARDPFLELALKPAEELTDAEKEFLLRHSFYSDPTHMIHRYPRYGQLFESRNSQYRTGARSLFSAQEFRDLQMWSQLAWFDEEFQEHDAEVREWIERGRGFTPADQRRMGEKQREIISQVLPEYARLAAAGQIEISTTPYYHPILPLVCDSNIAGVSHPHVPLPARFRYPGDAKRQLELARQYVQQRFGVAPAGLWPSEGSVSDEVFAIAAEAGFQWAATDSGVLNRTKQRAVPLDELYRPYEWRQEGRALRVLFRDHYMSDLIGFVYGKMEPSHAAADFLHRIRENCEGVLARGRDALVPIILDGENAWEYYYRNGRPFLAEVYGRISKEPDMRAVTISEAHRLMAPEPLDYIFPGSWINANFDVWIGAEEDNDAWAQLLRARATYDAAAAGVPEDRRALAYEELLIAEGSDWCWWYGPEHDSANRVEFDQLYRGHLANVYRFLNLAPPEELSRPILRAPTAEVRIEPTGAIQPVIDGEVTSYFEWLGAGMYRIDERSGAMHGGRAAVRELHYGTDGTHLFLRVDFRPGIEAEIPAMEARLTVQSFDAEPAMQRSIRFTGTVPTVEAPVECAFRKVLEVSCPIAGPGARFQLSLWIDGLPVGAIPHAGWIEVRAGE